MSTNSRASKTPTHISRLASDFLIQMVNPYVLRNAIDRSTDLHIDGYEHLSMGDDFTVLLKRKYENCSDWFLDDLATEGVKDPLIVLILPNGLWWFDDGHHRLMYGLLNNVELPVLFDVLESVEDVIDNHTAYVVTRPDGIRHDHRGDEPPDAEELVNEAEDFLLNATVPIIALVPEPRSGKHRAVV